MAWSHDAAKNLIRNPDFRSLFEDEESPVLRAIRSLERVGLDPRTAPDKKHEAACQRAGILFVLEAIGETLDAHDREAAAEADRLRKQIRPVQSRYLTRYPS